MEPKRQESNNTKSEIVDGTLRLLQLQSLVAVALTFPQAVDRLDDSKANKAFV
jgi:hypothetical protein